MRLPNAPRVTQNKQLGAAVLLIVDHTARVCSAHMKRSRWWGPIKEGTS